MFIQVIRQFGPSLTAGVVLSALAVGLPALGADEKPSTPPATAPATGAGDKGTEQARPTRPARTRETPPAPGLGNSGGTGGRGGEITERTRERAVPAGVGAGSAPAPDAQRLTRASEGVDDRPPVCAFEPEVLDYEEMIVDVKETLVVKVKNITEQPIQITDCKPGCGCTAAQWTKDPIAPGEYGEATITLSPGSRAPTTLTKQVTFYFKDQPKAVLKLKGNVTAYVMADTSLIDAPKADVIATAEPAPITLTSGDGTPFRIVEVVPPVILDIDPKAEPKTEHKVHINWPEWQKAGSQVKVTVKTDHPKGPNVPLMVRKQNPRGTQPPALTPAEPDAGSLVAALRNGDVVKVREALAQNKDKVNVADRLGRYPIHWAVDKGNVEIVKALVEAGADTNVVDKAGKFPLAAAAEKGKADVVKALLDGGAKVDATDKIGGTAFLWAAALGKNPEILKLLKDHGADPNVTDIHGMTPLLWASLTAEPANVKALLDMKANVHVTDQFTKDTPIMRAVRGGKVENIKLLAAAGADVNAKNQQGLTAFLIAAETGSAESMKALIDAGADVKVRDQQGLSAYNHAKIRDDGDPKKAAVLALLEKVLSPAEMADVPGQDRPERTGTGQPVIKPIPTSPEGESKPAEAPKH